MKLVAGLGNPGAKYQKNRHNLGFVVVDSFVKNAGFSWKYSQDWIGFFCKQGDVVFFKPSTFMNDSGSAIKNVANFYNIKKEDVLIVYDEVDLPFGTVRLAFDGLSAGHKGVDSIIKGLGGVDFGRLRVGVGHPKHGAAGGKPSSRTLDVSEYVLEDFSSEEKEKLPGIIKKCEEAISSYLADGIEATMNKFN